jgi:hypothetical protein
MQCTFCLYEEGRSHARQAEYLAPYTETEQDLNGNDIPKIRYSPVCEEHMIQLYQAQLKKFHYPFVRLFDGVFHTWPTFAKANGLEQ